MVSLRTIVQVPVAFVLCSVLAMALGLPVPSWGIFLGATMSALMDLDRKDHPPYTTPFSHSIFSMTVWEIVLLAVLGTAEARGLMDPTASLDLATGLSVGPWSHLLFDLVTGEVLFTFPRRLSIRKTMGPFPLGDDFRTITDDGTAVASPWNVVNRIVNGELVWPYWGRITIIPE